MLMWTAVGAADGAYNIAVTSVLYGAVPNTRGRPAYFAVCNVITTGLAAVGSAAAVPVLNALKEVHLALGPLQLGQYQLFYGAIGIVMIPCLLGAQLFPRGRTETC